MNKIENLDIGHVKHGFENKFMVKISDVFNDKTLETDFPHRHKFYMICLVIAGSGTHVIDFEKTEIKANRLFFIRPEQVHFWNVQPGSKLAVVQFSEDFLTPLFSYHHIPAIAKTSESCFDLPLETVSTFWETIKKIESEFTQNRINANKIIRAYIFILLSEIECLMNSDPHQRYKSNKYTILDNFRYLINLRYKEVNSVKGYAKLLNVTPNYLNIIARETTGHTANELIHKRIILEAKRLLTGRNSDVSQVAYDLGFKDASYFARFFRKCSGVSPSAFRRDIYKMYQHHNE